MTHSKLKLLRNHFNEKFHCPNGSGEGIKGDYHIIFLDNLKEEVCRFNNNSGEILYKERKISKLPDSLKNEARGQFLNTFPKDVREEMKEFIQ